MVAMLFWIVAALMTAIACLAVLVPIVRRPAGAVARDAHDLEVYRDQMAEVDRDASRGLIDSVHAEQARAEIGRRILRLSQDERAAGSEGRTVRFAGLAAVLAVPLIGWGVYAAIGSPDFADQPLSARLAKNPNESTVEELIARAERHLAQNPGDAKGWDVLGPVYMRQDRFSDAATAFANAIRLDGSTAAREAGLGEALAAASGGIVTAQAKAAFERALAAEPGFAKARFYLATALAQEGRLAEAADEWRSLQATLAADSPWRGAVEEALAEAGQRLAGKAQPGPDAGEIAAAKDMSAEDRTAMVETMVANLDQKLRDNPADADGWQRLIRSYVVLGRADDARQALGRAIAGLGEGSAAAVAMGEFAGGLGVTLK